MSQLPTTFDFGLMTPARQQAQPAPPVAARPALNMTAAEAQALAQQMQDGTPLQAGPSTIYAGKPTIGPLTQPDPSQFATAGGAYGTPDNGAPDPSQSAAPSPSYAATVPPASPTSPSLASLQSAVSGRYPAYAPPTAATSTGFVPTPDVAGYYDYNSAAQPFTLAPSAANQLTGIVQRGGALTPGESALARQLGIGPAARPGAAAPLPGDLRSIAQGLNVLGVINPDQLPVAAAIADSQLRGAIEQRLNQQGLAELGLRAKQLELEQHRFDKTSDPRTITALIAQGRAAQGNPMTPDEISQTLESMQQVFGTPTMPTNPGGIVPPPGGSPGGLPGQASSGQTNTGNPFTNALNNPRPVVSTSDQLRLVPGGRDALLVRQKLGQQAASSNGAGTDNFQSFMQGLVKDLGDAWVEKNFPLVMKYAGEQYGRGVPDFINPSLLGKFVGGLYGIAHQQPNQAIVPLSERIGGTSNADVLRAKIRDALIRHGMWNSNNSTSYTP